MASITSAIFDGLKFSEAEAAFRPWWDQVEDFTVYALVLLVISKALLHNAKVLEI